MDIDHATILCVYNLHTNERMDTPLTRHAILALVRAWDKCNPQEAIIIEEIRVPRTDAQRAAARQEAN